jgi:pyruvate/2-oxoglutarate/acetoin dehydrogenase E1 component
MRVPLAIFVWDDGYGISVPIEYQTTKGSISEALAGFQAGEDGRGLDIYTVKAWDYASLCETFEQGLARCRESHIPALFHVQECTQPQGHSTSGSHERYKSAERLAWEKEFDGLTRMRDWMLASGLADEAGLEELENEARESARAGQKAALQTFTDALRGERDEALKVLDQVAMESPAAEAVRAERKTLAGLRDAGRREVQVALRRSLHATRGEQGQARKALRNLLHQHQSGNEERYHSHQHSQSAQNAMEVEMVPVQYAADAPLKNGFEILNACFRANLERDPAIFAFGEDLGRIGDVNQGFAGLQEVFGEDRVFDVGIRENSIMGQGIGMALRGLRPIAEIQYLDYLIYGLQPLTDDLATLQYRTKGQQKAPCIVRTRGHRLEGIWHTGSPIGMIVHALRGMRVCVPRNMTQAAGMYNTLLRSDEPALVIECLNGYRLKERLPQNVGQFTIPLGQPEVLRQGDDLTLVTYGSCVRIAQAAADRLAEAGISTELIDVQTLLPFDIDHAIADSVRKTNRLLVLDEDVPGGASAYILQEVLETQRGYRWLDAAPATLTAHPHRSPYGSDGDYASKPSVEDVFEKAYAMMVEADPAHYPAL